MKKKIPKCSMDETHAQRKVTMKKREIMLLYFHSDNLVELHWFQLQDLEICKNKYK